MARDAVTTLEETRKKLIEKLPAKKREIDNQLRGLGYDEKPRP